MGRQLNCMTLGSYKIRIRFEAVQLCSTSRKRDNCILALVRQPYILQGLEGTGKEGRGQQQGQWQSSVRIVVLNN